jgi:membrane-associated phospholipid phosphatase
MMGGSRGGGAEPRARASAGQRGAGSGPAGRLLTACGRRLGAADQALFAAVAGSAAPSLDEPARRLSQAANYSRLWIAIAAGIAAAGGPAGRKAAVRGLLSVAVTSATVNIGVKSVRRRERPDRTHWQVPLARQVAMPSSASFPSGHSAAGFAFASSVGHDLPGAAPPLLVLAAAVASSRVYTGVHFPGDVIFGSIIGAAIGQAVARLP